MAYFSWLILLVLPFVGGVSFAESYSYWVQGGSYYTAPVPAPKHSSPTAACEAAFSASQLGSQTDEFKFLALGYDSNGKPNECRITRKSGGDWGTNIFVTWNVKWEVALPPECGPNQELDTETNTCVCKTGDAGSFAVSGDTLYGCNDGCSIVLNSGSYSSASNKTYGYWRQNGNTCSPAPDAPGVESPDSPDGQDAGKCPTGQCPGTFNGQFMCVPCKGKESSDSSSSENTTETPNGASAPSSSASQSQSGSKSTECEGGVCTTKETVVIRNPDGSTTEKQNETTESISDYCAKNPKAAICKSEDAGQWGGACAGGFQCTGDPVQCAQAREVAKLRCVFDVSPDDPLAVAGGLAMNGELTPSGHPGAPGSGATVNVMEQIDTAPAFGSSGNCISDRTFSVIGMSLTLPFASMCPYFNMIGNVFLSCCYLVAGFIVFRR